MQLPPQDLRWPAKCCLPLLDDVAASAPSNGLTWFSPTLPLFLFPVEEVGEGGVMGDRKGTPPHTHSNLLPVCHPATGIQR